MIEAICLRAKPHHKDQEEEFRNGVVSIGWPGLEELSKDETTESLQLRDNSLSLHDCTQILTFLNIKEGGLIVVPGIKDKSLVCIYETIGTYYFRKESIAAGNPHSINVRLIKEMPKAFLANLLQRAINASRRAVSNFTKHNDLIRKAIDGGTSTENLIDESKEIIMESLKSEDEEVKLNAAMFILKNLDIMV